MNGLVIILIGIVALGAGYLFYGRWLAKKWGIDPNAKTPAYTHEDGEDYVPSSRFTVFSHQFSSIAGAGPVTGPILASVFGWVPVLLWLIIGGLFFGAVQDFGALYASVKNEGKSMGMIIEKYIGKTGRKPKALVQVALYGMPYKIDQIMSVADKYDIPVIEDAAEGFGSKFDGQVLGTFGKYGVLSFNGNKMITTSGGGALICPDEESKREIMFYATQARESYPYYQHERIGYNYRMSNICAGIGRGQMTVVDEHIAHHKHLCGLYRELLADVEGITFHENPSGRYDSNYWLNTVLLDENLHVRGEEDAYRETVKGAVGGAAGVTHESMSAHTSCEPNRNVEAMRVCLDKAGIESRPLWKPMHLQPVYSANPAYVNGVSEGLFRRGLCLPSGPYVTDEDVRYIVNEMKKSIL